MSGKSVKTNEIQIIKNKIISWNDTWHENWPNKRDDIMQIWHFYVSYRNMERGYRPKLHAGQTSLQNGRSWKFTDFPFYRRTFIDTTLKREQLSNKTSFSFDSGIVFAESKLSNSFVVKIFSAFFLSSNCLYSWLQ